MGERMSIRRNSKKQYDDPFCHTNLATLCGSIPNAMKVMGMGDILKSYQDANASNLVVSYPSFAKEQDDASNDS